MVKKLEKLIQNCNWRRVSVFTLVSGSAHLNLHGVSDVAESDMFGQFSERIREWNPLVVNATTTALCSLAEIDFNTTGDEDAIRLVENDIGPLMPSQITNLSTVELPASFGSLSFFSLPKSKQTDILTFAEGVRNVVSGQEMDIWSCGDMAKLVGNRLMQMNTKSESNKTAVLIFDRLVELGTKSTDPPVALDSVFSISNPLKPRQLNGPAELSVSLQKPQTPHESRLFAAMMKNDQPYCRTLCDSILTDILSEEEIEFSAGCSFSEKLQILKKNEDAFIYNAGFLSSAMLLTEENSTENIEIINSDLSDTERLSNLVKIINTKASEMRLEDLRQLIESTLMSMDFSSKLDEDEFGLISSGLSIYLEDLNPQQRHEAFPYFNIQNFEAELGQIQDHIVKFINQLRRDITSCQKRFGQYGMAQILETLLMGMPNPNFLEHHEAGLLGRLTSGFSFFGNQTAPKTARDYNRILVVSIGGITFAEGRAFQRLGEKYNKIIQIVSNKHNVSYSRY